MLVPIVAKRVVGADLWTAMQLPDAQWVMVYGRNAAEGTFFYGLVVALTLGASALTYRYIEVPGREWTRRWLARPQPASRVQAANP